MGSPAWGDLPSLLRPSISGNFHSVPVATLDLSVMTIEREKVGHLPVWGWAVICGLVVWALYVFTLAPTTAFWDTSEYIATAHILGMPHPPGNPLFVVMGRVWELLLGWTGLSVAARINLFSASVSAAAAVFWFLAVARIWAHFAANRTVVLVAAFVSVWVGATGFTVWNQSNVNAKVYTVSLLFVAVVTYLAMVWEDHAGTPRGDRIFVLCAFLLGLGAANHTMSLLPVGALGFFVLWHDWKTILRWRLMGAALLFVAIGFSVQVFFVPIRSAQNPIIDEADAECESLVSMALTPLKLVPGVSAAVPDGAVCEPLRASLARDQYGKPPLGERQSPFSAQLAMFSQYFDWQWAHTLPSRVRWLVTIAFIALGLTGLRRHWRGDRDSFVYFFAMLLTLTLGLIIYLNFKYGFSLYPDIPVDFHEVRERDYFYVLGFYMWGLYAGMGIAVVWERLASRLDGARGAYGKAAPVLGLALIPLVFNFGLADRRGDFSARDWAYNILQSVEPYAILFTNGDNDTFPLWYLQEVEGIRRDVTVIVHSYLGTSWYPKQLRELTKPCPEGVDPLATPTRTVCQRPFEASEAISAYRDLDVSAPTRPIHTLSDEEIDALPVVPFVVQNDTTVQISRWVTGTLRGGSAIYYPDLLVYQIIRESLDDRPIYFAATAPPVYDRWGLQPHMLRQGLAHKVVNGILEDTADTVQLQDAFDVRWVDLGRSEHLLWDVYQIDYLLDWDLWPEKSTRASIPAQYYLAYASLGEAYRLREKPDMAEQNYLRAELLLRLSDAFEP